MSEEVWRSHSRFSPGHNDIELPKLQIYWNAFPANVCQALHTYILAQPDRKVIHPLTDPDYVVPRPIEQSLHRVPFLGRGNTVITKRYEPNEDSGAFEVHRDPKEFEGNPLVLCTLGGRAVLSVITDDRRLFEIECAPNTVVVVHDNPMHTVTSPLYNEIRTFMFTGTDSSQNGAN